MKVWDLHCDTLSELRYAEQAGHPKSFEKNDLMVDLTRMKQSDYLLQCMACFVYLNPEREPDPLLACMEQIDIFNRILEQYPDDLMQVRSADDIAALKKSGKVGLMLTVEEGGVCLDSLGVLRDLYRMGVRMMTLTWNFKNGLAEPNSVPGDAANVWPCAANTTGGLTEKGFAFVEEMERLHMILDVAHLSDAGILDVLKAAKRPFISSHSNARACCPHVRNLTDEMLREMGSKGCLIGLNYCASFLDDNPDRTKLKARITDMARHAKHIINMAGEDSLALGSDFDGIEGDLEIAGAEDMPKLAEGLVREGISPRVVEKIFHGNAERFFAENL
ncbi:MAG: dipeptidase [Oscillospiraceae bacterium]|nr:dipeptidase [Oscillospiraceae bacterium]